MNTNHAMKRWLSPSRLMGIAVALFLIWFIVAFLMYPNLSLLLKTFIKDGSFTFEPFRQLWHSGKAMKSLLNSFILAFSLMITVNIAGVFLVMVTEYFDIRGAKILKLGYFTTLVCHGIILIAGYQYVYGPSGVVTQLLMRIFSDLDPNWFTGYGAVLFVMTFAITSNHVIFLSTALRRIDYQTIEVARNMGASEFRIITQIVLPVLKPSIIAITILNFHTGITALSSPMIQGGDHFQSINSIILILAGSEYSRGVAAALSIILGLATFLILTFLMRKDMDENFTAVSKVSSRIQKKKIANKPTNFLMHAAAYLLFVIYLLPLAIIFVFSFTDSYSIANGIISLDRLTLSNYIYVFSQPNGYKPYLVSLFYCLGAAVLVVVLCLIVARILHKSNNKLVTRSLEYATLIPWLLPSSMIALGLIYTYNTPKWLVGNYVLVGSIWIMLLAYIVVSIPFSIRLIKASFFGIDGSLEEAAKSMGAKTFYTFRRVILPMILPTALAVIALNFNGLLVNYDVTAFLYHPLLQPLSIVITSSVSENAVSSEVDTKAVSLVYSVVIMIISSISLYLIYGRNSNR
ncbi:ABC transporter permease [Paenibacillus prosopidis]|uniref:Iron(III) transport system permease protein n=1 Tax=Paenibacillus prosopidis TaxID=630520 RepID=A0A368W7L6_9BACL|nr:iron ABC transporter permease [Paenibacillus prosopidis]RCW49162.1 iron(III) transport system permease protein [Paenibacillus prosopidis]